MRKNHGYSQTPQYRVWKAMRERCSNPNYRYYDRYGGRGIKVCERWNNYTLFLEDMGIRPLNGTIERVDNDGDYELSNCRWASRAEQSQNKSNNFQIEYKGRVQNLSEWAVELNMSVSTLHSRLTRANLSIEEAFNEPIRRKNDI